MEVRRGLSLPVHRAPSQRLPVWTLLDYADTCPGAPNAALDDGDSDGIGDVCDAAV